MRKVINTPNASRSPLYSQAVKAGQHVCRVGLGRYRREHRKPRRLDDSGTDTAGAHHCHAVLQAAGATLADVVEVGVLLTCPRDFACMNDECGTWFPAEPPPR